MKCPRSLRLADDGEVDSNCSSGFDNYYDHYSGEDDYGFDDYDDYMKHTVITDDILLGINSVILIIQLFKLLYSHVKARQQRTNEENKKTDGVLYRESTLI